MVAILFSIAVAIIIAGWLWFFVVRPIWEDFSVKDSAEEDAPIMSRAAPAPALSSASSLQTDSAQTDRQEKINKPTPEQYLTLFKVLRAAGVKREDVRPALKGMGLALDNNVWRMAEAEGPEEKEEDVHVTPYAGRRTLARYYPDEPELEYKAPN